jgi:hypothetical protein
MQFIARRKILGTIKGYVWRIEYQKRGLPHAHILFWADFDPENIDAAETVINVRYLAALTTEQRRRRYQLSQ